MESSDQAAHERSTFIPWIDHELISKTKKTLSGRELSRSFSNTEYPPPDTWSLRIRTPFAGAPTPARHTKKINKKITSGMGWLAYIAPPWWPGTTQQRTALPLVAFVTYEKGPPFHHHPLGGNSSSQCTGYLCPLVKHHVDGDPSQQQGRKSKSDFASR